jgi:hypothetical protein
MKIFAQEIEDGLEAKISTSASICYASVAEPCLTDVLKRKEFKTLASLNDSDLYYVQSILVSSSWNKNDDIFDKAEVWLARNTPEDKPTNLEHDESVIIGHITSNWPITEDGSLISEATDMNSLPEKYHILTGSVIYRAFSSPELKDRAEKLIADIESGNKFVSMECFFKGFDYGLINKSTGKYKTLARNDSTAYLTKYLRAYGGLGEHEDYKIGRVLRNITFSGKGFVEKPANPDSVIFTKDIVDKLFTEKNDDLSIAGVSYNQSTSNVENNIMSSNTEVVEVKPEAEASTAENSAPVVVAEVADQTTELEAAISAKDESIAALSSELETLKSEYEALAKKLKEEESKEEETEAAKKKMKEDMESKDEEMKKTKSELSAALEAIAAYKMKEEEMAMKEEEMAKKEKKTKRKAALLSYGFDEETSEATLSKFESLSDDAFDAMTSLFAGKLPPWLDKIKKDDKDEEDMKKKDKNKASSEAPVDPSVLETVEAEESVNLSVGSDAQSSVNTTRAELVEFVCARLGKKLNKGD